MQKKPVLWCNPYTGNARDHIQKKHPTTWTKISGGYNGKAAIPDSNQQRIDRYILPIGLHQSREITLREAYDRPRHIQAMIALYLKKRLALSATD